MSISKITAKQHFSEVIEEINKHDAYLGFARTRNRLLNMSGIANAQKNAINLQCEGKYAQVCERIDAVY